MIGVIFEVVPRAEHRQEYLDIAASLRPKLDEIDGFISIERFESLSNPGKILSLSYWRDESSIVQWRGDAEHRVAQQRGRAEIFATYTIRIATIIQERSHLERSEGPTPTAGTSVPQQ